LISTAENREPTRTHSSSDPASWRCRHSSGYPEIPTGNIVRSVPGAGRPYVQLNSTAMRQPALATRPRSWIWMVQTYPESSEPPPKRLKHPGNFWGSLRRRALDGTSRYALEDLKSIGWARAARQCRVPQLRFAGDRVPSWLLSDVLCDAGPDLACIPVGPPSLYIWWRSPEEWRPSHRASRSSSRLWQLYLLPEFFRGNAFSDGCAAGRREPLLCFTRERKDRCRIIHGENHSALNRIGRKAQISPSILSFSARGLKICSF